MTPSKKVHLKNVSGSFFLEVYLTKNVIISAFHIPCLPENSSFTLPNGQEISLSNQFVDKLN
jgi:hypothetical protein